MKKAWARILITYIVYILFWMTDYPFLYWKPYLCHLWEWIDPTYLLVFFIVGMFCCVCVGKQSFREFSDNILNIESGITLAINAAFVFSVLKISAFAGHYEIDWAGAVYQCILCLGCVGFTEEWIFRGFMVTQLNKVLNSRYAVVLISSVLFAFMHLSSFLKWQINSVSLWDIGYRLLIPFLLGIVFSLIYIRKKNLFTLIVTHGVYDLIAEFAFGWWYYIAYAIYWIMIVAYVIYCYKTGTESCSVPEN